MSESLLRIRVGGGLLGIHRPSLHRPSPKDRELSGSKRGKVTSFSRDSRRRLLHTIASFRRDVHPLFATLTYPKEFPAASSSWKEHLKLWAAKYKRRYPNGAFIWRLEFQRRGAPHYHLLLYGAEGNLTEIRPWLSSSWYETVASADPLHLAAGTNVQSLRSKKSTMRYASKELGKVTQAVLSDQYSDGVGRWWGAYFRKDLPWAESVEREISEKQAVQLLRLMRRYARMRNRHYPSLTILCDADWWHARLDDLIGDT